MRLHHVVLAGVATAAMTSGAVAADLIIEDPIITPVYTAPADDWSGFYAGIFGGYGAGVIDLGAQVGPNYIEDSEDIEGYLLGVQLGYNWQMDQLLLGIQTDLAYSTIASSESGGGEDDTINWLGSTTLRLGAAMDSFLPYVKGGLAYAGGTGHQDNGGPDEAVDATFVGWTAGAGLEFAVADNVSLFAEYDYYAFGTQTLDFVDPANTVVDATPSIHVVKGGVNFRF